MLFKGSKNYSHLQIKREVEGRGGALNAFTSQEIAGYYAHFLNKNLARTLDILLDMVSFPLLKKRDIDKERNVILEEIKMYNDFPSTRAGVLLDGLLWPSHPLGQEVIGYKSTVKVMRALDLEVFRNKYYIPSNMVISFSGAFPKKKITTLLADKIEKSSKKLTLKTKAPLSLKKIEVKCEKKNLEQSHLCIGFRSVSYLSSNKITAQLINVILGANMSSRLFEELREKKSLCYDISTETRKYKDSGAFLIHVGLDKSKVIIATKSILRELSELKNTKVSFGELSRAKDYYLGQIAMNLERPQGRMFYLAESYLTLGKIHHFTDIKKKVEAITSLQIKELAGDIFNFRNICISCVGNINEGLESQIRQLLIKRDG